MALGYSHPAITKVIREQAGKLVHCSNLFYTEYPSAAGTEAGQAFRHGPRVLLATAEQRLGRAR